MYKIIFIFIIIFVILYYLNDFTDGWLLTSATHFPKLFALAVAVLALMFPHDYEKVPDIIEKTYHNYYPNKSNNFMKKRMKRNVTESMKKYVAANQKWNCKDCHRLLDASYEIDHIIPLYKGGNNNVNNLQALCRNCHGRKTLIDNMIHQR